jgi:phage gpG-like protein
MSITVTFNDTTDAIDHLRDLATRATRAAAEGMGAAGQRAIIKELSVSSHPPGTKTTSAPGSPPALVTGQLRRSVRRTSSVSTGEGTWETHIAPTTVYARIQELGGRAGRDHRSTLPPRPYVTPAITKAESSIQDAATKVFQRVIAEGS